MELKLFYRTHDRHYTVYWDRYDEAEWAAFQEEYALGAGAEEGA
ncbi:MAG: hypothetical protein R2751_20080 [Bacteroidales bacterium]